MEHPKLQKLPNPVIIEKGWGREEVIVNNDEFCCKMLIFNAGAAFSSHFHKNKREVFYILKGKLEVSGINTEDATKYSFVLSEGEALDIPRGVIHKLKALDYSVIIEVSTHHEDSDSYRVEPGDSQLRVQMKLRN